MGINKGKYILVPGSLTFPEEKLLQFFGQLLGVIIRADIPVGLDIMPYFWKVLLGKELTLDDLREADIVTYTLTEKILQVSCIINLFLLGYKYLTLPNIRLGLHFTV